MSVQIQFSFANIPSLLFLGNRRQTDMAAMPGLRQHRRSSQRHRRDATRYVATVATPN
jgi:hypothetical protein